MDFLSDRMGTQIIVRSSFLHHIGHLKNSRFFNLRTAHTNIYTLIKSRNAYSSFNVGSALRGSGFY